MKIKGGREKRKQLASIIITYWLYHLKCVIFLFTKEIIHIKLINLKIILLLVCKKRKRKLYTIFSFYHIYDFSLIANIYLECFIFGFNPFYFVLYLRCKCNSFWTSSIYWYYWYGFIITVYVCAYNVVTTGNIQFICFKMSGNVSVCENAYGMWSNRSRL